MNRKEIEAKLVAKCWKDPSFKHLLQDNPEAAFKDLGFEFPKSTKFALIEEGSNSWTFVLPASPTNASQLSDAELEKMAAADKPPPCQQGAQQSWR